MDRARRFFKKITPPRLVLPRRGDLALSQKALDFVDDLSEKFIGLWKNFKRFLRTQAKADWETRIQKLAGVISEWLAHPVVPRHLGKMLTLGLMIASLTSGVIYGNHIPAIKQGIASLRDDVANLAGYEFAHLNLTGGTYLKPADIREIMGVKANASLLFLDIEEARKSLLKEPWIADVKITKNLPQELRVIISERKPAALWQYEGKITTIASDGTVLLHEIRQEFRHLPLLVGKSADSEARGLVEALDTFPEVKEKLRAAVLISERSWRLLLKNGPEIKMPEKDLTTALGKVMRLDQSQHILSKDISSIDVRLDDRVTLRVNEGGKEARIFVGKSL
jgi:cell division protein FtsQ